MAGNILALLDFSHITGRVVEAAASEASLRGAKCWLMHVAAPHPEFVGYDVGPQYIRDGRADVLKEEHQTLQEYKRSLEAKGVEADALLVMGPLFETIRGEIEKLHIDLVVLGSHGRTMLHDILVGSVCEYLLRNGTVPLLIIPAKTQGNADA